MHLSFLLLFLLLLGCDTKSSEQELLYQEIKQHLPILHSKLDNDCFLVAANAQSIIKAKQVLKAAQFNKILWIEYRLPADPRLYGHAMLVFTLEQSYYKRFYVFDEQGTAALNGNVIFIPTDNIVRALFPKWIIVNSFYAD